MSKRLIHAEYVDRSGLKNIAGVSLSISLIERLPGVLWGVKSSRVGNIKIIKVIIAPLPSRRRNEGSF